MSSHSSASNFRAVVECFNKQQWQEIAELLHQNVMVKKVDDADSIGPKRTLLNYLRGMQELPQMAYDG